MPTLTVEPRATPAERAGDRDQVEVDEQLSVWATMLEEWVAYRADWELFLREGHEFGRRNNVEAHLLCARGDLSASLTFRLEQLENVIDTGAELVLFLEERDGRAKVARLSATGLDVELYHILTFT